MHCASVDLIYFSPTATTKQVLEYIAQGMAPGNVEHLDLTLPQTETSVRTGSGDIALLGVPVYGGRVPLLAAKRLGDVHGQGKPAVVVAVYGNRAYEGTLVELQDIASRQGFVPVAAGAFIGEHSFATQDRPIANGRPDEADAAEARAFGVKIQDMLVCADSVKDLGSLHVPGAIPDKERPEKKEVAPVADPETCILCGTCAESCPSGAISINEAVQADPSACILCHACVKNCPTGAIAFHVPPLEEMAEKLSRECRARQEPEIYLPMR
ncbi:MAG: 4Fe-4S binding protein [Thermodesulfobacteriota bacterium]